MPIYEDGRGRGVSAAPISRVFPELQSIRLPIAMGAIASDGIAYSSAVTFGTVATNILSQVIDAGVNIGLKSLYLHLIYRFTNRVNAAASMSFLVRAMRENIGTANWVNLMATISQAIGTASATAFIGTLSGFLDIGSLPALPLRLQVQAIGTAQGLATGEISSLSYLTSIGATIPGV